MVCLVTGERCRAVKNGKWVVARVDKVNKKTIVVDIDGTKHTMPLSQTQKLKKVKSKKCDVKQMDSVLPRKRLSRYRRPVKVTTTRYNPVAVMGNFGRMLQNDAIRASSVCMFNDNVGQFEFALHHPSEHQHAGGGNAIARPYEHLGDAIGICTGPFHSLTQQQVFQLRTASEPTTVTTKQILITNFERIILFALEHPEKEEYFYSVNPTDPQGSTRLGLAIFAGAVGEDVITFISRNLQRIPQLVASTRQTGELPNNKAYD